MNVTIEKNKMMSFALAMLAIYATTLIPADAWAGNSGTLQEPTALSSVLCSVVGWFTGSIGAGIATLAIIVIGIGALMGKVSWGMAIIVGLGVAVIFGAPTIVTSLSSSATTCDDH